MVKINVVILLYITIFLLFMFLLWQGLDTCHREGVKSGIYLPTEGVEGVDTCEVTLKQLELRLDVTFSKLHRMEEQIRKQEIQKMQLKEQLTLAEAEISKLRNLNTYGLNHSLYNIIYNDIMDMWYYIRDKLQKIAHKMTNSNAIETIMKQMKERKHVLLSNVNKLISKRSKQVKVNTMKELSAHIQNKIHYLQNPKDCSRAKKLICSTDKVCGFGCQLHHIVYCFIAAYATNRTFILESDNWSYSGDGWTEFFKPLSTNCFYYSGPHAHVWGEIEHRKEEDIQVIRMPFIEYIPTDNPPFFFPPNVPTSIATKLKEFQDNPFVWWVGQFVQYLLRTNIDFNQWIDKRKTEMGFTHPIAAIHVRRSDKISAREAQSHGLEEYMNYVDEYYDQLQHNGDVIITRKVYIATDDASVFTEATQKYPHYVFLGNRTMATISGDLTSRYTSVSLQGLIADIYFLSHADHVVGTFSSQVSRVAYELMHSFDPDADRKFNSLDDVYYFGGSAVHYNVVIHDHIAQDDTELTLHKGDLVIVEGNHWNGYSKGKLKGSPKSGLFPSFKVKHNIEMFEFT